MAEAAIAHVEGTISLTEEGGGTVATCRPCGWLRWSETRQESVAAGKEHKCRADDLKAPPGRRYPAKKKRGR